MKKTVAIIFGGKSAEHEVSLRSARNIVDALDKNLFQAELIGITKQGTWLHFETTQVFSDCTALVDSKPLPYGKPVTLIIKNGKPSLYFLDSQKHQQLDIAFPILHGTMGEDGSIQGLFKMMNLPFVGCGIWSSAAGMDKEVMKRLLTYAKIPNARYRLITSWNKLSYEELSRDLGVPFFIKPANAGSSVGVHKIKNAEDYKNKLVDALKYDHKVLAEEFIQGREVECSVMGLNHSPKASLPGEVIPQHEFYSYEAKYLDDNGALLEIPAKLDKETVQRIQKMACETFQVMGCDGLTRVDFFVKSNGDLYINEINTIPGFTKISMYPKMWEATGLKYTDLITQLLTLGLEKHQLENQLITDFSL